MAEFIFPFCQILWYKLQSGETFNPNVLRTHTKTSARCFRFVILKTLQNSTKVHRSNSWIGHFNLQKYIYFTFCVCCVFYSDKYEMSRMYSPSHSRELEQRKHCNALWGTITTKGWCPSLVSGVVGAWPYMTTYRSDFSVGPDTPSVITES